MIAQNMPIARKLFIFCLLSLSLLIMTACTPQDYRTFNQQIDQTHNQIEKDLSKEIPCQMDGRSGPLVLSSSNQSKRTSWLKETISLHAEKIPFSTLADKVLQNTGTTNSFDSHINTTRLVSINFHGTRQAALDNLAAQTGYAYLINDDVVSWSDLVTKTFDVSFMPGASKYLVGNDGTQNNNNNAAAYGGSTSTTGTLNSNGQYSNLQANLSIWDDLKNTITNMLSEDGKVNVSQATTTITITDHPTNVHNVENYLNGMNKDLSRQVALDVQVLEITLDKAFNYGIDWNLVRTFMEGRYATALTNVYSKQISTFLPANTLMFQATSGVWGGTQTFINALSQQGKVSVSTQPRVVTLNNQVAEIGINTQTTYLAEVTTTATTNAGVTTSLTPGEVTSGFTLYILPKVQGDHIYLQISSTIANLISIKSYSANPGSSSSSQTNSTIYAPIVTEKRFNQRSLVPNGATLVLAGFKQLSNEANKSEILGSEALGGKAGEQKNNETIVLITPTIIHIGN